jgi:hypothetical protein
MNILLLLNWTVDKMSVDKLISFVCLLMRLMLLEKAGWENNRIKLNFKKFQTLAFNLSIEASLCQRDQIHELDHLGV